MPLNARDAGPFRPDFPARRRTASRQSVIVVSPFQAAKSHGRQQEQSRSRNQPLSPAARRQPGAVVSHGATKRWPGLATKTSPSCSRSATRRAIGAMSWPTNHSRITRLPSHEPAICQHQGGPRRTPRPRPYLPAGPPDAGPTPGRLAIDHVSDAGRSHAVFRRHLFSAGGTPRTSRLPIAARTGGCAITGSTSRKSAIRRMLFVMYSPHRASTSAPAKAPPARRGVFDGARAAAGASL